MNKRIIKYALLLILSFVVLNIVSTLEVSKAANSNLTLELGAIKKDRETTVSLWKIKNVNLNDIKKEELDKLTDTEITNLYGTPIVSDKNVDNKIIVSNLENAIYYIRENQHKDMDSYIIPILIELPYLGNPSQVDVKYTKVNPNEKLGAVSLEKLSDSEQKLKGVGFKLYSDSVNRVSIPLNEFGNYDKNGKTNQILYTNENGLITVKNLPFGKYVFEEVKPLDGYIVDTKDVHFTIDKEDEIVIKVYNRQVSEKLGSINFLKISSNGKKPLEGARFKITRLVDGYYQDYLKDNKVYILESDKDGLFKAKDLPYGTYYLWETTAPKGHILIDRYVEFEIDENSSERTVVVENKLKPSIEIPKTGDTVVILALVMSIFLFVTGHLLSKKKEK